MSKQQTRWVMAAVAVLVFGLGTACGLWPAVVPSPDVTKPVVTITSPSGGQTVPDDQDVSIQSVATDSQGVARVELWVDGQLYRVDASPAPDGQTSFVVSQPWHAAGVGRHLVEVKAYDTAGEVSEPAAITLYVGGGTATPTPRATPTITLPTAAPASPVLTTTPTVPSPTTTPPTSPPTATPTPSPTATPGVEEPPPGGGLAPTGHFRAVWEQLGGGGGPLGFALAPESERYYAYQSFEHALMYWRDNRDTPDVIYVLVYDSDGDPTSGRWHQFEDRWVEGQMPEESCNLSPPPGRYRPVRGFGKLWCERSDVRASAGWALQPERGESREGPVMGARQDFQRGAMLRDGLRGRIYVLYDTGDWRAFPE